MPLTPAQMAQMQAQMQVLLFKMFVTVVPNLRLGVIVSIFLKDANAANGNDECTNGTPDGELTSIVASTNFLLGKTTASFASFVCCFICVILAHYSRILEPIWSHSGHIRQGQGKQGNKQLLTLGIPRGFFFRLLTPNFLVGIFCFFSPKTNLTLGLDFFVFP